MKRAITSYRPNANWLSMGVLTLFVVSFGIFAEAQMTGEPHVASTPKALEAFCSSAETVSGSNLTRLIRYH